STALTAQLHKSAEDRVVLRQPPIQPVFSTFPSGRSPFVSVMKSANFCDLDHRSGTPAAGLPSAPAHPWQVINASATDDNTSNRISGCDANAFRRGQPHDRDTRAGSSR